MTSFGPMPEALAASIDGVPVINRGVTDVTAVGLNNFQITYKLAFEYEGRQVCVLVPAFALPPIGFET